MSNAAPASRTRKLALSIGLLLAPLDARSQAVLSATQQRAAESLVSRARGALNAPPGQSSRDHQDMIADSLVLVASISAKGSPEERSLAESATFQLGFAGSAGARNPYRGAGVRLQRLLDATSDRSVESIAIYSLSQLADSTQARDALRQLIMRNRRAARAISLLQMYHGAAGLETLRQVYASRPTLDYLAQEDLERLAEVHGWRPGG